MFPRDRLYAMERVTISTRERETEDGETEVIDDEWVEVNNKILQSVQARAMEDNKTFGDALVGYLAEHYDVELADE